MRIVIEMSEEQARAVAHALKARARCLEPTGVEPFAPVLRALHSALDSGPFDENAPQDNG